MATWTVWSWQISGSVFVKFDLLCTSVTTNFAGEKKKFSKPIFNLDFLHGVCLNVCLQEENRNQIFIPETRLHSVYFAANVANHCFSAQMESPMEIWVSGENLNKNRIWDSEQNLPAFQ